MSKVAAYLQEHILGEVTTNAAVLEAISHDGSVLEIKPEMVIYPRVTNDIRKVTRFAWQLAEKGHILPVTARGSGSDQTGGAIGRGIVLITPAHMNHIFELDAKQKLVRLQPGVTAHTVNQALQLQGMGIPPLMRSDPYSTVGGAIANNTAGLLSGRYGDTSAWVQQLEVVLANGDILQTGRLSKRELNKKKGLQTLEGEIYRGLDNLIEDNKQVITDKISADIRDNAGYNSIVKVKRKDGSFDLTPLIAGSQGTLGIISEMIMKSEFVSSNVAVAAIAFGSGEAARDALDGLYALEPAFLEYYDGALFDVAATNGKMYDFYKTVAAAGTGNAVVLIGFDDFNERARARKLKKVTKQFQNSEIEIVAANGEDAEELMAIREVTAYSLRPETKGFSAPPILDGAYIPAARFEDFSVAVTTLGAKYHIDLALHGRILDNVYFARPSLQLHKVGDKQKIFKLLDEYSHLVDSYKGHLIGEGGEGRVKARFAHSVLDDDIKAIFTAVKEIFDPFGILNPGVKQSTEIRELVSQLRADHDTASHASYAPYN
jgi:FAD/FMN-containing dehydrogenase